MSKEHVMSHIIIFPTDDCNLACPYCFEGQHQKWRKCDMTLETGKKSVDFIIEQCKDSPTFSVQFFGGEPTLRMDLVGKIAEYAVLQGEATGKKAVFSLTSNLTLLDYDAIEILKKYSITLVASIDGMPTGEGVRYFRDTRVDSGYEALRGIMAAHDAGVDVTVRWTLVPEAVPRVFDSIKEFVALGLKRLVLEFVYESEWDKASLDSLEHQLRLVAKFYIEEMRNDRYFHFSPFERAFSVYTMDERRTLRCGLAVSGVGIGTDGTIAPCHRFIARDDAAVWELGNVWTGLKAEKRQAMIDDWHYDKIKVDDGRECKDCPVKIRCPGGSCFPTHLDFCNDFYTTPHAYCDLQLVQQRVGNDVLGILYGEKNPAITRLIEATFDEGPVERKITPNVNIRKEVN